MDTRFKKPLSGIIPPLVTPLKNNETLDVESLERLIEHLIEGGVHGLFVLGTTGEEQSLSYDVRKQMIKESCRINRGRLPLLACITDTSIEESIRLQQLIMQISTTIYTVGRHGSSYLKGLKCALSLLGIINDDFVASPFYKFEAPEREKIRQALDALPIKNGKLCI